MPNEKDVPPPVKKTYTQEQLKANLQTIFAAMDSNAGDTKYYYK